MLDKHLNITDEQLFARFNDGDENAFNELVDRYYKQIYRFLVRFTGQEHLAEDLIQEVFVKLYKFASTFDPSKRFRPWIYQVAANTARDYLRAAGRNGKQVSLPNTGEESELTLDQLVPGEAASPDEAMIEKETSAKVKETLMQMQDQLREILILAYYNQLSYKDIADSLEIPLGTVKSRLHKAVLTFGEIWKRHGS
jgi:RNA polymerase sigma-70 factor (ECF subfamily)